MAWLKWRNLVSWITLAPSLVTKRDANDFSCQLINLHRPVHTLSPVPLPGLGLQGRCCEGEHFKRLYFTSGTTRATQRSTLFCRWRWGWFRTTWFALHTSSLLWPAIPYCLMKNMVIVCQILKLKEQPEHLRPCYHDKWVSGKTDVILHVPLPQPVKLLFNVSFVSALLCVCKKL